MASVRRVGTGHYCLRSRVHYDEGPLMLTSIDGAQPRGELAVAVGDANATYCDRAKQEAGVTTYIIIHGLVRLSNNVRFVGDPVG